jgi:hypothetical protein
MKFVSAYYLFLLYLTVVFQPLIPIICDAFAHTFENEIHLATIHAHYGSNHLETTLAEAGADSKNNEKHATLNNEEPFPVHFSEEVYVNLFSLKNIPVKHPVANLSLLPFAFIAKQFPPPKFSWN